MRTSESENCQNFSNSNLKNPLRPFREVLTLIFHSLNQVISLKPFEFFNSSSSNASIQALQISFIQIIWFETFKLYSRPLLLCSRPYRSSAASYVRVIFPADMITYGLITQGFAGNFPMESHLEGGESNESSFDPSSGFSQVIRIVNSF